MSKTNRAAALLIIALAGVMSVRPQDMTMRIDLSNGRSDAVSVSGEFGISVFQDDRRVLEFLDVYAGSADISRRISRVEAVSGDDPVSLFNAGSGRFTAGRPITGWSFLLDLKPTASPRRSGHVSWLGANNGAVFLDDIVPQFSRRSSAVVEIVLPSGWKVITSEKSDGRGRYEISDTSKAFFYLTKSSRGAKTNARPSPDIWLDGNWRFDDAKAGVFSDEISLELEKVFGVLPDKRSTLVIAPFPLQTAFGTWEADARGSTIVIFSADKAFGSQSNQFLHEQLRHELFHQWIPNSLDLKGRYDWFYEGFALYQSLKIGVRLGRIRFADLLETLSNAERMASFSANGPITDVNGSAEVYARGMVAAFYLDVLSLDASGGKRSVETFLKTFFNAAKRFVGADANRLLTDTMLQAKELKPFVEGIILSKQASVSEFVYNKAGLRIERASGSYRIGMINKPAGAQRALLKRLGYNGSFDGSGLSQ